MRALKLSNSDTICYPDHGAFVKYMEKLVIPTNIDIVNGVKVREPLTGQILSMFINGNCLDKNVLIVDDICDRGGTFIMLSDLLYKNGAKSVNLYVSHGLFTGGAEVLRQHYIERIFTKEGEIK